MALRSLINYNTEVLLDCTCFDRHYMGGGDPETILTTLNVKLNL